MGYTILIENQESKHFFLSREVKSFYKANIYIKQEQKYA